MGKSAFLQLLGNRRIIPATRSEEDFARALDAPSRVIAVLYGDILHLPAVVRRAKAAGKVVMVHLDLVEGVGRDRSGVRYLAGIGVQVLISTKPHLIKMAREEGMFCIQRLFLMDSEALRTGSSLLKAFKPDALEILPGVVPGRIIAELAGTCGLPVLAGGLIATPEEAAAALKSGATAVSTSRRELWRAGGAQ